MREIEEVSGFNQRYFYSFKCLMEGKLAAACRKESPLEKNRNSKEEESLWK